MDEKETLRTYLQRRRSDLLGTLDGLDEYDVRRPLTPTGTNLLGLVKHVASVQLGYFGEVFGRSATHPVAEQITALDAAEALAALAGSVGLPGSFGVDAAFEDADMWAPAEQSRVEVLDFFDFSSAHSDATIDVLPLDATGTVPWWPADRCDVTMHQILVHVVAEVARHAGHADIMRELIDGRAGNGPADPNIPARDAAAWQRYVARIDDAARAARR
ncbi:DinB family protein [Subtercola boreus]|uniref:DinB family protein n=1 Tax=Subtercola boreus TaxID=120213 RepID=A0A3E0WDQ4_9MICO|nr:DinB family protein [Subtercola boreus]RFA23341.1 hypothetical protein B7R24_00045 [Subtercola boreus]RFA23734.1 hypothetical protein B7R23_00045 [Subtercola boreus]RFA29434.1 hypothetical protein B7R25_00040 [Subtercola boreus]